MSRRSAKTRQPSAEADGCRFLIKQILEIMMDEQKQVALKAPMLGDQSFVEELQQLVKYMENNEFSSGDNKLKQSLFITMGVSGLISTACYALLDGIDEEEEENLEKLLDIVSEDMLEPLLDKLPRFQRWGVSSIIETLLSAAPSIIADRWNKLVDAKIEK